MGRAVDREAGEVNAQYKVPLVDPRLLHSTHQDEDRSG